MSPVTEAIPLTRKDFVSPAAVRWCPGCGDYSILSVMQSVLPELGIPKEKIVFVSGIGCSSRFPYYMNTYGFHTIHGRAPAIATGVKLANPELQTWVITGDGDALSIGGNHFIHALRRNQDLKIILFNNKIYGLTKGQYSPTSDPGTVTSSSPFGAIDHPLSPLSLALGAEATFIARTADNDVKHMTEVFRAAAAHKGTALVEVLQNCVVFADKVWDGAVSRTNRQDGMLYLKHGEPMRFGKELEKGITLNGLTPVIKTNADEKEILVHDEAEKTSALAYMLSRFQHPEFPIPVGILRCIDKPVYTEGLLAQINKAQEKGKGDIRKLLRSGGTWMMN